MGFTSVGPPLVPSQVAQQTETLKKLGAALGTAGDSPDFGLQGFTKPVQLTLVHLERLAAAENGMAKALGTWPSFKLLLGRCSRDLVFKGGEDGSA